MITAIKAYVAGVCVAEVVFSPVYWEGGTFASIRGVGLLVLLGEIARDGVGMINKKNVCVVLRWWARWSLWKNCCAMTGPK